MENNQATNNKQTAIIVGAGPAGLTAAHELLKKTDIRPIILEQGSQVGGISKTINYKGWRFDIGPHRFFTKSSAVSALWEEILPKEGGNFLKKERLTRIYYNQSFFDYPVKLSLKNLKNLGTKKIAKIIFGYLSARLRPVNPEISLEDFFINRFGRELYKTFFKSYTEKVWGVSCCDIPKNWGAQRVKNLSLSRVITNTIKKIIFPGYKTRETSLIDSFFYPKMGAGAMYEKMAAIIIQKGGEIKLNTKAGEFELIGDNIISVQTQNLNNKSTATYSADYFFSSQPLQEFINNNPIAPPEISKIAAGLVYRDLILVVLIYKKLNFNQIKDNWIYIQEEGMRMGRLDIFNNFSNSLLKDGDKSLLGAEFFCNHNDELWKADDASLINLAKEELKKMGIALSDDFLDGVVCRQPKAYPAYFGTYNRLPELQDYLNSINNLYLIGRNGQHRYNNMDHSILSALTAVNNIVCGRKDKKNIWAVNTEDEYHE